MVFELDATKPPAAPTADALVITTPESEAAALIPADAIAAFTAERDAYVAHWKGFVITSPESLEEAGAVIDTCITVNKGLEAKFKSAVDYFFRLHRSFTGQRAELMAPLVDLEKLLRGQTVSYRQRVAEEERRAAQAAEAAARALADAQAKAAREAADAEAKAAKDAADALAAAAEKAAADDPDAAMEAEALAQAAASHAIEASAAAAAVASEPVYVPPVYTPPSTLVKGAGGGTLVDKWVPEYIEDEASTVRAIVAALGTQPQLIGLLSVNEDALKKMATALKGEARIPGVNVKNKPIDRRSSAGKGR